MLCQSHRILSFPACKFENDFVVTKRFFPFSFVPNSKIVAWGDKQVAGIGYVIEMFFSFGHLLI